MDFFKRIIDAFSVVTGRTDVIAYTAQAGYQLQVKYLHESHIGIEAPKKDGDTGYDLVIGEDVLLPAHTKIPINTRTYVAVKIPSGFWGAIVPRSSANKRGIKIPFSTIDEGYIGELFSAAHNDTDEDILLKKGDRISQLVIQPRFCPEIAVVKELPQTERGETGFGSTNKKHQESLII